MGEFKTFDEKVSEGLEEQLYKMTVYLQYTGIVKIGSSHHIELLNIVTSAYKSGEMNSMFLE